MEYSKYSEISPQWTEFVSQFPQLGDLDQVGIVERRRIFDHVEASLPKRTLPDDVNDSTVSVRQFAITARDGFRIPVRSYIPVPRSCSSSTSSSSSTDGNSEQGVRANDEAVEIRAVMVYLHAGGFLFGDLDSGDMNCRILAKRLQISVLNVGYRTAPEWKFPHGVQDAYDAVAWVSKYARTHLSANPHAGFVVGGISSGANLAAVTAYTARDTGLTPQITALWLSIPLAILPSAYQHLDPSLRMHLLSLVQNAENPLLTAKSLGDIQTLYGCPAEDARVSFLLNKRHDGLPLRLYVQVCGRDPLRDEAMLWEKLVRDASQGRLRSKIDVYSGLPHGFWRFLGMRASWEWIDDLIEGLRFCCDKGGREHDGMGGREVIVKGDVK